LGNLVIDCEIAYQITRLSNYQIHLCEKSWELRLADRITGKDRSRISDAQVTDDDFAEHISEIGGDRDIAAFVAVLDRETWPATVHASTSDATAKNQHRVAVAVVGAAIAIFADGSAELAHRENHRILHAIAKIGCERGD
jgi:hypothetical protein